MVSACESRQAETQNEQEQADDEASKVSPAQPIPLSEIFDLHDKLFMQFSQCLISNLWISNQWISNLWISNMSLYLI